MADPIELFRGRLRRSRHWVALRAAQRDGFAFTARRLWLWRRVLSTPPIRTPAVAAAASPGGVGGAAVHLLCWERDHLSALWALKSLSVASASAFPLVVHVQGSAPPHVAARFREHLPDARVVTQAEADAAVEPELSRRGLRRLLDARRGNAFMLKLIDFPVLATTRSIIMLDSDVLFFRRPEELIAAAAAPPGDWLFQRDLSTVYNLTPAEARTDLGVELAERVNTGIAVIPKDRVDLERYETWLEDPRVARSTGWMEQTLLALRASETGPVKHLPATYAIPGPESIDPRQAVAIHYPGPTRPRLTTEGLPALLRSRNFSRGGSHK